MYTRTVYILCINHSKLLDKKRRYYIEQEFLTIYYRLIALAIGQVIYDVINVIRYNRKSYITYSSRSGFPKLLVDRYPLDTVAGLHVPPKFCDVSLKKKAFS